MDLGIKNKWALVCGASKGLGLGCAQALVQEGANVLIVARGAEVLEASANKLIADYARVYCAKRHFVYKFHGNPPLAPACKTWLLHAAMSCQNMQAAGDPESADVHSPKGHSACAGPVRR